MEIKITQMTMAHINSIQFDFSEKFDNFWSIDTLRNDFKNENSYYIAAIVGDEVVGFAGMIKIIDEMEIMNIVTRIDKRNLGIGSSLLEHLIQVSKDLRCNIITLEVNENNLPAINLYEKYNFERIGFRKKYYNNMDSAILMEKKI